MPPPFATIVLDNEAVRALADVRHPKHRAVLPYLEGAAQRRRSSPSVLVLVPVAVRVEAGWNRSSPAAAVVNRVSGARDVPLTSAGADRAERFREDAGVSVVDATVAAAVEAAAKPVVVLTSDVEDLARLAAAIPGDIRIVRV